MKAANVLRDGRSGIADVETGKPMTEHTHMLATSISKRFVGGLCIARELEGRLALDLNAPSDQRQRFSWPSKYAMAIQ
jgi:CubicO group peptidase (beta-lactamase class C family)